MKYHTETRGIHNTHKHQVTVIARNFGDTVIIKGGQTNETNNSIPKQFLPMLYVHFYTKVTHSDRMFCL